VVARRSEWPQRLAGVPAQRLVFVDESGAHTQMTRRRGRCARGQRLVCRVPQGRYRTTTMIAGVRLRGPCAPWVLAGALDGPWFVAWLKEALVPTLQRGDVVVLDNLSTHKVAGVQEALEAVGARLEYLPPYSPDFNPMENLWSKLKQGLRTRAPRSTPALYLAVGAAFADITPQDCKGFFLHAGYAT
jgi:transposase